MIGNMPEKEPIAADSSLQEEDLVHEMFKRLEETEEEARENPLFYELYAKHKSRWLARMFKKPSVETPNIKPNIHYKPRCNLKGGDFP